MEKAGKHTLLITMLIIVCLSVSSFPLLSCSSSSDDTLGSDGIDQSKTARLVSGIVQTNSIEERVEAINKIVNQGYSLGLLDEKGNQLNDNVAEDAVSLTPDDITAFASFVDDGRYNTVGNVVDYLAEVGVVLVETGEIITTEDFLPDLQTYVDWSFAHSDDPDSQLGILLASGPSMEPPALPPDISTETQISPMAAVLMLGDVLIGKPEADAIVTTPFMKKAYAAEIQQTAANILGLITKIESTLSSKPVASTAEFFVNIGKKIGWVEKDTKNPLKIEIPTMVKKIISAFAFGNHFAVRMRTATTSANPQNFPVVTSVKLNGLDDSIPINMALVLAPPGYTPGAKSQVINNIPVVYTARLLSPNETGVGRDLYPDANAIMVQATELAATYAQGHIIDMATSEGQLTGFELKATKLDNDTPRVAILHGSASILTGDLASQFEKYKEQYSGVITSLGLKPEELADMFQVLKTAIKVSPWMAEVILGNEQVTILPAEFTGKPGDTASFTAQTTNMKPGYHWGWEVLKKETIGYKPIYQTTESEKLSITFPEVGTYLVTARLYEGQGSLANLIGEDEVKAVITAESVPLEIEVRGPDITGTGQPLVQGQEYSFIAKTTTPGGLPDNPLYVWGFANEGSLEIPFTNEAAWAFSDTGNWLVWVDLYDTDTSGKPIQSASFEISVVAPEESGKNYLNDINQMKKFHISLSVSSILKDGRSVINTFSPQIKDVEVFWNGVDFHMEWDSYGHKGSVTGHVSPDGTILEQLIIRDEFEADGGENQWTEMEIADLPFWEDPMPDRFAVDISDENVGDYVVNYSNYRTATYSWDDEAYLQIRFTRE
ncbi:MAG: hypothetical protein JW762_06845 [Dehalococcoidales bacterium]|nr:hypothetical protein [Dehalococcoidales bacterium]